MTSYTQQDLQITRTGITADWFNELLKFNFVYRMKGLDAVIETLLNRPMLTYEGRMLQYSEYHKDNPEYCVKIAQMYAVTDENRGIVRRIDDHVTLFNRAAREGRLTDRMYKRFYSHLLELIA